MGLHFNMFHMIPLLNSPQYQIGGEDRYTFCLFIVCPHLNCFKPCAVLKLVLVITYYFGGISYAANNVFDNVTVM